MLRFPDVHALHAAAIVACSWKYLRQRRRCSLSTMISLYRLPFSLMCSDCVVSNLNRPFRCVLDCVLRTAHHSTSMDTSVDTTRLDTGFPVVTSVRGNRLLGNRLFCGYLSGYLLLATRAAVKIPNFGNFGKAFGICGFSLKPAPKTGWTKTGVLRTSQFAMLFVIPTLPLCATSGSHR